MYEIYLTELESGRDASSSLLKFKKCINDDYNDYLELAVDYINCGMNDEALKILSIAEHSDNQRLNSYPMIYYYKGYLHELADKASKYFNKASQLPIDYCFPFRVESIDVLKAAINFNPQDAKAHYYLGNLLYEKQPEKAIRYWEKAVEIDKEFAIAYRNLGFAFSRYKLDIRKAIIFYEQAVKYNKNNPRLFYELDELYEMGNVSDEKRLNLLVENHSIVKQRDDALRREIVLYIQVGKYNKAIELLSEHRFNIWEGGGVIHDVYVDAHLLRGLKYIDEKKYEKAVSDFKKALQYPENLGVGRPEHGGRAPEVYYLLGKVYERVGEDEKAQKYYKTSTDYKPTSYRLKYYVGLSLSKLGQDKSAEKIFNEIIKYAEDRLEKGTDIDFFAKFGERQSQQKKLSNYHYILGLGFLGKNEKEIAKKEFEKSIELDINHIWAQNELDKLK